MNLEMLKEYAEAKVKIRELESEAEFLKTRCSEMLESLLEQFSQDGVQSVKLDGIGTVYLRSQLWAGDAIDEETGKPNHEATIWALAEYPETSVFVRPAYNTNTLSAWIRELPRDELGTPILPEQLKGKVRVTEKFDIRVNRR